MEQNFKRISDALKLPQESRERIRSQLSSYGAQQNGGIYMKKTTSKTRAPLIVAAVVIAMTLTLAAAATVVHQLQNDIIVSSKDQIPGGVGIVMPNGNSPTTLDEMIKKQCFKSDDWSTGDMINGGVIHEYFRWDFVEVLSNDPALRIRSVGRADGAKKMEYTAENPNNLLDTLTNCVTFDLSWMNDHYDYIPDANLSFVVTDTDGNYVSQIFEALYAKTDDSGYVRIKIANAAQENYQAPNYIIDGSYENAYCYTDSSGHEFLIRMHNGIVWADYITNHTSVSLYGAYLTSDEVEDIIDNLSLASDG